MLSQRAEKSVLWGFWKELSLQHPGIHKQCNFHQHVCHVSRTATFSSVEARAPEMRVTSCWPPHSCRMTLQVQSIFKNSGLDFAPQIHNSAVHLQPQPRSRCQDRQGKMILSLHKATGTNQKLEASNSRPPRYRVPGVSCPSWQFWRHSLHPWCSAVTV